MKNTLAYSRLTATDEENNSIVTLSLLHSSKASFFRANVESRLFKLEPLEEVGSGFGVWHIAGQPYSCPPTFIIARPGGRSYRTFAALIYECLSPCRHFQPNIMFVIRPKPHCRYSTLG
jgi:hypothetical protein